MSARWQKLALAILASVAILLGIVFVYRQTIPQQAIISQITNTPIPVPLPTMGNIQATNTPVPFPPPTDDPKISVTLERQSLEAAQRFLKIDWSCKPPCLGNIVPYQTPMSSVFTLLNTNTSAQGPGSMTMPNNITGVGYGALDVGVFSDATQPKPLVRAFYLRLLTVSNDGLANVAPQITTWWPKNVLDQYGIPQRIVIGEYDRGLQYYLLFDYQNWAVQYTGRETKIENTQAFEICPTDIIPTIDIWVYSSHETDALSLIQALKNYPNATITGYLRRTIPPDQSTLSTLSAKRISSLTDALSRTGCISGSDYATPTSGGTLDASPSAVSK